MKQLSHKDLLPKYKLDIRPACSYDAHQLFKKYENSNHSNEIDYDIILSNGKPLQRDFVWTIEQKHSLILSMLKRLQIPNFSVVIYRPEDNRNHQIFKIVDGKQRLKTIEEFYNGEFGIFHEGVEYFIDDLEPLTKSNFTSFTLNFNIIYEYDDLRLSDDQLISWFELVNFAGTAQDIEHLNQLKYIDTSDNN